MKTVDLIRTLAADLAVDNAPRPWVLYAALLPAFAVALAVVWLTLGFRVDLAASLVTPISLVRIVLAAALGAIGLRIALKLARPEGIGYVQFSPLGVIAALAVGLLLWAFVTTPAEGRQMATFGKTASTCLIMIPLLSILPVAAIFHRLRQGASTTPALAGSIAGIAGSGFSATIYALHCTEDSPLFYVTWYGLAILGVGLISALIGSRVLRW